MDQADPADECGTFIRLDRGESLRLLASASVGRLIFTMNALPVVRPINFVLIDQVILFRTAADSAVARKIHGAIVAFEADELDPATCSGWSVTVTGRGALATDPAAIARYRAAPLKPWAPGTRDTFITVTMELTEGRRIHRDTSRCPD